MTRRTGEPGQRGSAAVVLLGGVALVVVTLAALGRVGEAAQHRARVEAVADLVALAAVTGGEGAAGGVAAANRSTLVRLSADGPTVVVEVSDGVVSARAAARPDGGQHGGSGGRR